MHLKYGQSFVHQNKHSRNIFSVTTTLQLHICISDGNRPVVHGDMVIVIPGFSSFFLPLSNEIVVFSR